MSRISQDFCNLEYRSYRLDANTVAINVRSLSELIRRIDQETAELPTDMDGVPIHVGDTVWNAKKDAIECTVTSIELYEDITKIFISCRGIEAIVGPTDLTHTSPDSWERIADELEAWCDSVDVDGDACDKPRDLADRIRRLAKEDE
jgi:hypothetical protein